MRYLEIAGTGSYLPEEVIPNSFFTGRKLRAYDELGGIRKEVEVTEEGIFSLTGIRERRRAKKSEEPSDMGYEAAKRAIENAGIKADSLVGIICANVTESSNFPNAAQKIQLKLGAKNCSAHDIAFACAGFPKALAQADAMALREPGNYLVVATEKMSSMVDYNDLNSDLFGDGAGAVVLTPTNDEVGILATYSRSDPFEGKDKWIFRDFQRYCRMPFGDKVLKDAVRKMVDTCAILKKKVGWERADVYIPHQANGRIIEGVENRLTKEGCLVYKNIERYGNMSAATCAVALDEAWNGYQGEEAAIKPGHRFIITAYGGGATWAGVAGIRRAA